VRDWEKLERLDPRNAINLKARTSEKSLDRESDEEEDVIARDED